MNQLSDLLLTIEINKVVHKVYALLHLLEQVGVTSSSKIQEDAIYRFVGRAVVRKLGWT